jgi:REP element-mobilizing transposase RayT
MPRKQRIEYPEAVYHIISRGNYRKDLFTHDKTAEAFGPLSEQSLKRRNAVGGGFLPM